MSSKRKSLDLSAIAGAAVPQPDPVKAAAAPQVVPVPVRSANNGKTSRADKVQIQGYFPEETRRRLKVLAAQQGRTVEDLLGEAIQDLLAKHQAS